MNDTLEENKSLTDVSDDIFASALQGATGPTPEPEKPAETFVEPEPDKEPEYAPETSETPSAELEVDDEGFDLEAHTEKKEAELDPEETKLSEGTDKLRAQLSKEGKARKAAEEELAAKNDEVLSLQQELDALKAANQKLTASTQQVENHPIYQEKASALGTSIASDLDKRDVYSLVPQDPNLYAQWAQEAVNINQMPFGERKSAREAMSVSIAKRLKLIEPEDEDFSIDPEAEITSNKVRDVFLDHADDYEALKATLRDLKDKQGEMALELGYAEREAKAEPLRKRFAEFVNLSEELIADDPYSLTSQASMKLREDRALAKNLQKTIEEYRFGPSPYSQEELDSLVKAGIDPEDQRKARDRKVQKNNDYIDSILMKVLVDPKEIEEAMKKKFREKAKNREKKDTEDSMRELTKPFKKKPEPPKPQEKELDGEWEKGIFSNLGTTTV